ncbi:lysoplasmalogenase [Spirochaetota bacterium]
MIFIFLLFIISLTVKLVTKYFTFKGVEIVKYIITPMVVFSAILLALKGIVLYNTTSGRLIIGGLIFSMIADIYLSTDRDLEFICGIIFFAIVQVLYFLAFSSIAVFHWILPVLGILMFVTLGIMYKKLLYDNLDSLLRIGVPIYMILVTFMFLASIGVLIASPGMATFTIFVGAFLFWISDLVLAINAFYKKFENSAFIIWSTYGIAQMLIGSSVLLELYK